MSAEPSSDARCRLCRAGVHEFCERIFDPTDDCGCSHDPALDPPDDTLLDEVGQW